MKTINQLFKFLFLGSFVLLLPHFVLADDDGYKRNNNAGSIVVANRASGSISVIDVRTDRVRTIALPDGVNPSQPMYVVHSARADRVFVGDRANNRVVIFDDEDFSVEGTVPAGNGIFHMWSDSGDNQLWINNDIDSTVTVVDPLTLEHLATVAMPADLVALGGKPHDVILDPSARSAYVSLVGFAGENDYIVKFDTATFKEVARAAVGKDPHVSLTRQNKLLYVPCQNSDAVFVLKRKDLSQVKMIEVPGAHGAGMARNGKTLYTTNLPGGGSGGLIAIDTRRNKVRGEAVDTPFPVPHNIAIAARGNKLYVTHSGAESDKVSVYSIKRGKARPVLKTTLTVGLNPFGLAWVR